MAGSRKLSDDEVEALLGGLEEDTASQSSGQFNPNEVREFAFGSEDLSLLGDYYALRLINEKLCRFTRSVFLPMLRVMPSTGGQRFSPCLATQENLQPLKIE